MLATWHNLAPVDDFKELDPIEGTETLSMLNGAQCRQNFKELDPIEGTETFDGLSSSVDMLALQRTRPD